MKMNEENSTAVKKLTVRVDELYVDFNCNCIRCFDLLPNSETELFVVRLEDVFLDVFKKEAAKTSFHLEAGCFMIELPKALSSILLDYFLMTSLLGGFEVRLV